MASQIQISSPFLKSYSHTNYTVGITKIKVLDFPDVPKKRISLIIQNQSPATQILYIILNPNDDVGIAISSLSSYVFDNYNGQVWVKGSDAGTVVHIAEALN